MNISEKLITIAENESKIYNKGYLNASPRETVCGEAIAITDLSPIEHNMAVSVRGKNLIPYPYFDKTKTTSGITYTDNGDGSITINGTAGSTSAIFYLTNSHSTADIGDLFEDGKTYKIASSGAATFVLHCKSLADGKDKYYYNGNTFTVDKSTYRYIHLRLQVTNKTVDNAVVYPMIEKGTTSSTYAPYIADISTVKLYKCGKNLFSTSLVYGNFTTTGLNTGSKSSVVSSYGFYLKAGTYTVSGMPTNYNLFINGMKATNKSSDYQASYTTKRKITIPTDGLYNVQFNKPSGETIVDIQTIKLQVELGTTATEYEPYIEPTVYDVPTDGTVEDVNSIYPNITLYTDTSGAVVDCTYYQDGKKVKENLIDMILSLGGVISE